MRKPAPPLEADDQLGFIDPQLSDYMRMGTTYLHALKKCANRRAASDPNNPSCFTGNKSCKKWIMAWLERNRDFKPSLEYPPKVQTKAPKKSRLQPCKR